MKTYEESIQWLRDKGLLNKVFLYHERCPNIPFRNEGVFDVFKHCTNHDGIWRESDFISACMTYAETDEGFYYWRHVSTDFKEWVNN